MPLPLTPKDKKYFYTKISALRKSLQILEEELGNESPVLPRRRNKMKEYFEGRYELGIRSKPGKPGKNKKALLLEQQS